MSALEIVLFVAGLVLLLGGAEILVRGASRLAAAAGISPLVVGLTVVAFGTSSPELAISLKSVLAGQPDLAVGNAVGSNIFNVLLILGLSAAMTPLVVKKQLVRVDVPVMIAVSALAFGLALDGRMGRVDGLILVLGLVAYIVWSVRTGRAETGADGAGAADGSASPPAGRALLLQVALVAAGLALLVVGSRWFVDGAVALARLAGLSELVIGLTVVAAGTSMPEVATSLIAALRGERDIAVGNVVGSNIFNIFGVLGVTAAIAPGGLRVAASALVFDFPVMIAVAVACLPIFFTGHVIARWEGGLFLLYYAAYTAYLVLDAADHDHLETFGAVLGWFALPLTAVTLAIFSYRAFRGGRAAAG